MNNDIDNFLFTSDEHYGHKNIIKYCNRPFSSVEEMDETLILNFNSVAVKNDITIHGGDFSFKSYDEVYNKYISRLNGSHIFLRGSHDYWLKKHQNFDIWQKHFKKEGFHIVVCHYAMTTWPRSHYGSYQLFGHSHGGLIVQKGNKQYDIGVDNNSYYPVRFDYIRKNIEKNI